MNIQLRGYEETGEEGSPNRASCADPGPSLGGPFSVGAYVVHRSASPDVAGSGGKTTAVTACSDGRRRKPSAHEDALVTATGPALAADNLCMSA